MLILVVGPSGAGKDTVLSLARVALTEDPRFRFVRRVITRPADAGGEDHEAVTDSTFAERPFALQWQAHGLRYGIPADIVADLKRGIRVVANVSRGIIAEAAERFAARVIVITAPVDVLAQRLAARGRETTTDVLQRLSRTVPLPAGVRVDTVLNDNTPDHAAERFIGLLRAD